MAQIKTKPGKVWLTISESQHKLIRFILKAVEELHMKQCGQPPGSTKVSVALDLDLQELEDLEELLMIFE